MINGAELVKRKAQVTFDWADGTYTFRLPRKQLEELQELCDAGPAWVKARIESGAWRLGDLAHTIRLGLIGGGTPPDKARTLVRHYVEDRPLNESLLPAQVILSAVLVGVEDEPPKKVEGAEETDQPNHRSQTEKSDLLPSTDGMQSLE